MGHWGPPLRIARRTTRRSLGRTFLIAALIGLPVLAATWMGVVFKTSSPEGETLAKITVGQADGQLCVTQYGKLQDLPGGPSLQLNEPPPADGAEQPVRTPAAFDPTPLLPAGTTFARQFVDAGSVQIRGPEANTSVSLVTGDGTSPLTKGTVKLDQGRLPAAKNEVANSPSLADRLGLGAASGTVVSADGKSYTVVGTARSISGPGTPTIFASPDTTLHTADAADTVRYLVTLPASADLPALDQAARERARSVAASKYRPPAAEPLRHVGFGLRPVRRHGVGDRFRHPRDRPARRYGVRRRSPAADPGARPGDGGRRYAAGRPADRPDAGVFAGLDAAESGREVRRSGADAAAERPDGGP